MREGRTFGVLNRSIKDASNREGVATNRFALIDLLLYPSVRSRRVSTQVPPKRGN